MALLLSGFGNQFESEAVAGALPRDQNSPQQCPMGLYAEQLNGTAFTAPRAGNQRSWLYRRKPSVCHRPFKKSLTNELFGVKSQAEFVSTPCQSRWSPFKVKPGDFVDGLCTIGISGSPEVKNGIAIHIYSATQSMVNRAMQNADGDLLVVPQLGQLNVHTEFGLLPVDPGEIVVLQRGIRFSVQVLGEQARGYVLEVFDGHFELPDLGPIGANGLANPHHFLHPTAAEYSQPGKWTVFNKYNNELFECEQEHSPFDVVAWKGNYVPYKYDLGKFNAINSVSFDHPDPSIFTVLTCKSATPGTAIADLVVFPPRWAVAEHTFRPPYFHRNTMTEFMGLVCGKYEAKSGDGFAPGGASLHPCMSPHGPDAEAVKLATGRELKPERVADGTLAFMFETCLVVRVAKWALQCDELQEDYVASSWSML